MAEPLPCHVRPARSVGEVQVLWQGMTRALGWNRLPEDAATHTHTSGLGSWLMAVPTRTPSGDPYDDGDPQGCIAAFRDSAGTTGWLGFFVVKEPYRGHGLGRALFKAALDSLQADTGICYIGLDAVPEQRGTYGRRGFVETNLIAVFSRSNARDVPPPPALGGLNDNEHEEEVTDIRILDAKALVESEAAHCGLRRPRLWTQEALFHRPDVSGLAVVAKNNNNNSREDEEDIIIKGWILVRRCDEGYRIGPLYAERKDLADYLLHAAMSNLVEDKDVSLSAETWHSNERAGETFEGLGWKRVATYHRMWHDGRIPPVQVPGGKAERDMYAIFDAVQG
ncbi:acyl-CoA N-acyltransferase [Xylariaceae sp. FL0594]|nr:acyl-CoA N-acyltransferase [Xylariaceae sp. FL0594]